MSRSLIVLISAMLFALFLLATTAALAADAGAVIASLATERAAKTQPIEDSSNAMVPFYRSLAGTAAKNIGEITRIAHFGDSTIEMDLLSGPMRRLLQKKFGDSGHGFILPSRPRPWYRPYDVAFKPGAPWICFDMGLSMAESPDRRFGLGGAIGNAYKPNAAVEIGTVKRGQVGQKVSRYEFLFPVEPAGGEVEIEVDGDRIGTLNTKGPAYQDAYAEISVPDGPHKIEVTAKRKGIRLQGIILERHTPGIVYDQLGVNSSGVTTYLSADAKHWQDQLAHRNPALVVIGLGANDNYPRIDLAIYKKKVRQLIVRAKTALPNSTILWMAPVDRAVKQGSALVSSPMLPKIVEVQRQAAKEEGIAFWSCFDAMGGEGSMGRWYHAKPRLGAGDLFHPTPKGGEALAELFYNALMQGFADYLEKNGMPAPAPTVARKSPLKKVEIRK
jgi:lysophospholipase L1-like esterase